MQDRTAFAHLVTALKRNSAGRGTGLNTCHLISGCRLPSLESLPNDKSADGASHFGGREPVDPNAAGRLDESMDLMRLWQSMALTQAWSANGLVRAHLLFVLPDLIHEDHDQRGLQSFKGFEVEEVPAERGHCLPP